MLRICKKIPLPLHPKIVPILSWLLCPFKQQRYKTILTPHPLSTNLVKLSLVLKVHHLTLRFWPAFLLQDEIHRFNFIPLLHHLLLHMKPSHNMDRLIHTLIQIFHIHLHSNPSHNVDQHLRTLIQVESSLSDLQSKMLSKLSLLVNLMESLGHHLSKIEADMADIKHIISMVDNTKEIVHFRSPHDDPQPSPLPPLTGNNPHNLFRPHPLNPPSLLPSLPLDTPPVSP
ncbi:unnamed protein product [Lactuca virosa]|uniref:Uncharacterized protein n=1 Tax=Lactuca virosa TaxID=75947 RepID=A0AAU9P2A0_9ASTR|nr:unnamed protein product [Lactuca virosa]